MYVRVSEKGLPDTDKVFVVVGVGRIDIAFNQASKNINGFWVADVNVLASWLENNKYIIN